MYAFAPDLWLADGPAASVAGFRYPTRMAVIRLSDGGLFIWSPVALDASLRAEVDALGPVAHIVAPNSLHHLHFDAWRKAYPNARAWAAPGLAKRRKDIVFDEGLADTPPSAWNPDIDQAIMHGNLITAEVVFFHRKSGTVLFTDLLQNFERKWFTGWRGVVARLDNLVATSPAVPRKFRTAFTDRRAARAALARITAWPAERILMAHGTPVTRDAPAFLKRAFAWLAR